MSTLSGHGRRSVDEAVERGTSKWWVVLVAGILWLIYAFIVLSFSYRTVYAVSIFAGVAFLAAGLHEFLVAGLVTSWRWLHALGGVLCIGAGVTALVWPDVTFVSLAALVAWLLLFRGALTIVESLFARETVDVWWLLLIVGIAQLVVAFWAIGYAGRSIILLVVWVGAWALSEGIIDIVAAFRLKAVRDNRTGGRPSALW